MPEAVPQHPEYLQRAQRLNLLWRLTGPEPHAGSFRRRLVFRLRQVLAAALRPQEAFNAAVVDYVNSTTSLHERIESTQAAVDAVLRHRESLAARERRVQAAMDALSATHDELQTAVGVLQQAMHTLRHEVVRLSGSAIDVRNDVRTAQSAASVAIAGVPTTEAALQSHAYVGFEDQFRGTPEAIQERLRDYVPIFAGRTNVLDVGCGRGEFLKLLREAGIQAIGVDSNAAMVNVCALQGLTAHNIDALAFLHAQAPGALGGLFAAQVVEHLEPTYLAAFIDAAFAALQPGAPMVLETINPACWFAFFESYLRDITHQQPLHPDTLKYVLTASGFQQIEIRYRAPYPEREKLQRVPPTAASADVLEALNANVDKLNALLFTWLDYAAVGYRP